MRKYRTFFRVEELWVKIVSEDCPFSKEIIYADHPSESDKIDEEELQEAISVWRMRYKSRGLVPKPVKLYYYKSVARFCKEGRFYDV